MDWPGHAVQYLGIGPAGVATVRARSRWRRGGDVSGQSGNRSSGLRVMPEVRLLRNPIVFVPLMAVLVVAVAYRTAGDTALGVLGLLVGAVLGLNALHLGMLLGAVVLGVRVHRVV